MANKENIRKWVDALRSGKYKQCTGALTKDGAFCCLGVACETAILDGLKIDKDGFMYDMEMDVLPNSVTLWLGLGGGDDDPFLSVDKEHYCSATNWNDIERKNFEQIAEMIERTYL